MMHSNASDLQCRLDSERVARPFGALPITAQHLHYVQQAPRDALLPLQEQPLLL